MHVLAMHIYNLIKESENIPNSFSCNYCIGLGYQSFSKQTSELVFSSIIISLQVHTQAPSQALIITPCQNDS